MFAVAVVDVGGARDGGGGGGRRTRDRCECSYVEDALFRGRPGLSVVQMAWHPGGTLLA